MTLEYFITSFIVWGIALPIVVFICLIIRGVIHSLSLRIKYSDVIEHLEKNKISGADALVKIKGDK